MSAPRCEDCRFYRRPSEEYCLQPEKYYPERYFPRLGGVDPYEYRKKGAPCGPKGLLFEDLEVYLLRVSSQISQPSFQVRQNAPSTKVPPCTSCRHVGGYGSALTCSAHRSRGAINYTLCDKERSQPPELYPVCGPHGRFFEQRKTP